MPGVFDHGIAVLLLLVWPLWSAFQGRKEMQWLAENPSRRLRSYWTTLAFQWSHALVILAVWAGLGRPWGELGLVLEVTWEFWVAAVVGALILGALWIQWYGLLRDPERAARVRGQIAGVESFVPTSPQELRAFRLLAVTAGICEELAYRGFLLWYLGSYMPLALAIPAMAVVFGAVHLYQGPRAALQIAGVAVVGALFYVGSGSLWIPMVLHVLLDLNQLAMVRAALGADPEQGEAPATG